MKVRIIETGEIKDLTIKNNGIEWTRDLMGDSDLLKWNDEDDIYELPQEEFAWWEEYIANKIADDDEIKELAEKYGDVVYEKLTDIRCELGDEHQYMQAFIDEIKEEFEI